MKNDDVKTADPRGTHTAAIWLSPDMLHNLLNLPPGAHVVHAEGRAFPTGIRIVIEDPDFPLVPYDSEPPLAYANVEVVVEDETDRKFVRYTHQWPKVLTPFTESDLTTIVDGTNRFPFVENDRANITGYGHQDKASFAHLVCEYDQLTSGEGYTEESAPVWGATDVTHAWAVRVSEELCVTELNGILVDKDTPGAFPVTTIWNLR